MTTHYMVSRIQPSFLIILLWFGLGLFVLVMQLSQLCLIILIMFTENNTTTKQQD